MNIIFTRPSLSYSHEALPSPSVNIFNLIKLIPEQFAMNVHPALFEGKEGEGEGQKK